MKIGIFLVFRKDPQGYVLGGKLVQSIRKHMPGEEIVHLTDETSPQLIGTDLVRKVPNGKMLECRIKHYSECEGEWLLLDTDVMVKQSVRDVFNDASWDLALADRNWSHNPQTHEAFTQIPYNTGVVFSRNNMFWHFVLDEWSKAKENDWNSEQRAVWQVIRTGQFRVKILPGMVYNYPPKDQKDPCTGAALVHYKGQTRKLWMRGLP